MIQDSFAAPAARAVFAGGCFWCLEADFKKLPGVLDARSGYAGGTSSEPNYKNYERGGHIEVVEVSFDPERLSYGDLVEYFWRQVDPTDPGGQFCDRGYAYSTAIFHDSEEQKKIAQKSLAALQESKILPAPVVTRLLALERFWLAEEYHQDYAKKHPIKYKFYRNGCGRDRRIDKVWRADTKRF